MSGPEEEEYALSTVAVAQISRRQRIMGWVAVALSTLIAAFFAMFAIGEAFSEGWGAFLAHGAQMLPVVLFGVIAVRWPRVGGSLLLLAALVLLLVPVITRLIVVQGATILDTLRVMVWMVQLALPIILAGILFFYGRPSPRKLAYGIIVGVPLAVFAVGAMIGGVFAGEAPVAQRVSPTAEDVTVVVGQSQIFTISAQDPDGNLRGLEWVVEGERKLWVELKGGQAQESFETVFMAPGNYRVEAIVDDTWAHTVVIGWTVTVKASGAN